MNSYRILNSFESQALPHYTQHRKTTSEKGHLLLPDNPIYTTSENSARFTLLDSTDKEITSFNCPQSKYKNWKVDYAVYIWVVTHYVSPAVSFHSGYFGQHTQKECFVNSHTDVRHGFRVNNFHGKLYLNSYDFFTH